MSPPAVPQLVILISGRGSNMLSIADACGRGELGARVSAVIADQAAAAGLAAAAQRGLTTRLVAASGFASRETFDTALAASIAEFNPDIVALAGFMRILGAAFVHR